MISGANEEELEMASVRADIMIALNEKYGNYNLLDKLDKYQENEKQQLISFLEERIKECDKNIDEFFSIYGKATVNDTQITRKAYQEVLDFVNKGGKE